MASLGRRTFRFAASYGVTVVLLFLLLVLVFFGTLEQVDQGLYEVQKKYFESLFVVHDLFGVIPLPLPGVYLLLGLLLVNLVCGGILAAPKSWRRPGLLIAHGGIVLMILAGFVTHHFALNGHMTLYEGESADEFQSYHAWEIALSTPNGRQYIIPGSQFVALGTGRSRVFYAEGLPFELKLEGVIPNCEPRLVAPGEVGGADGVLLEALPLEKESERNVLGAYATALGPGGQSSKGVLWGLARVPWVVTVGGQDYAIDLRRRRWKVPFRITLDAFTRELHPRTGIPSSFMSEVTKTEDGVGRKIEIKMNEPLRHQGYTFFQASWGPQNAQPGTPFYSTFSVVKNPADQWPLYSSCLVSFGLLLHFLQRLYRYLRAQQRGRA